jgi:RNA polymerase sigma factor (sigma-70 family)
MVRFIQIFQNDQQLINSIRNGDDSALAYLYDKNIGMIMKYILQNSGTEFDATEILRDALVVLWEKILKKDFALTSKLSTFIFGISRNIWLRELTRRKKLTNLDELHNNPGDLPDPEERLEKDELVEIVKQGMKKLSDLCRNILIKFYFEEKSMLEISQHLGLANEDVAKSKKYQCKKELERLIKKAVGS